MLTNKDLGVYIKHLRENLQLSTRDVCEKSGISIGYLSLIENGNRRASAIILKKLANVYDVDYLDLYEKAGYIDLIKDTKKQLTNYIKIPVLGRVIAGVPMEAIEEHIGYEEIDPKLAKAGEFFALVIKGNSMEPHFFEGDIVIVKKLNNVENGDIAVVLVNGEEATVKRIMKDSNGITLVPFNNAYLPRFYPNEEIEKLPVQIIGRVMENRRKY